MSERLDFTRGYGQCLALNHNATLGAHQESPECRHWEPRVSKEQLSAIQDQLRARDEALRVAQRHLKRARELELSAFGTDSETLAEVNTALAAIEEAGK